jgi:hypothetical protein
VSDEALDRLIARWAREHAPEVVAQAKADALEQARARLRARMADALVDAAAEPADAPRTDRPPESLLWVYGVVPASCEEPPTADGVDRAPVRVHRHGGVAALVSVVPGERFGEEALRARLEELDALEALARAHEAVLQAAMTAGVVVPFRLCTIYSSPARLDAMLEREGLMLTRALERLDGMQEWGVKAFLRAPAAVSAAAEDPEPATGTEYLSRKREQRDATDAGREEIEAVVAAIHGRLVESAAGAALSRPHDRRLSGREAEMVLNAAYLIPAAEADAFRSVVEELGRRHDSDGVALELTGPWPPHHFVETPEP